MPNLTKNTNDLQEVLKILANKVDSSTLQPKHDEALNTESKEIVGAINEVNSKVDTPIVTTTGTGAAYEATVEGITELKAGVSFIMMLHERNTSATPSLNVNGFGEKTIRRLVSNFTTTNFGVNSLNTSIPFVVRYDGNFWLIENVIRPAAVDLIGRVPVYSGGVPTTSADNTGKVLTTGEDGIPVWKAPVVSEYFSKGLAYTLSDDGTYYSVTGIGTCEDTNIVIPKKYNGLPVTSIGDWAFYNCTSLSSIEIPDSVTSIGSHAFNGCSSLTSIVIPDSVTSIGDWAFDRCSSLASIEIPDSVTSIGSHAFLGCSSLTIYCEAESQPNAWNTNWNSSNRPVVWGFAGDFVAVNDKLGDISAVLNALITKSQNILEGGTE